MFRIAPTYEYVRDRMDYGRPVNFTAMKAPSTIIDIESNPRLKAKYVPKEQVKHGTQLSSSFSFHEVMTLKTPYKRRNENHFDTGWPKEVLVSDPEQVMRYRRKQEKDDRLVALLPTFQKRMSWYLALNTAIDVYGENFSEADPDADLGLEPLGAKTVNVFRPTRDPRAFYLPVSTISWSEINGIDNVAVTCADLTYQKPSNFPSHAFVWTMGNQISPNAVLKSPYPCTVLEFSDRDPQCLAAGLQNGQVAYYDLRQSHSPVEMSPLYTSFRDPVTCILWTSSKTGTEFYSSSTDGQVIWWDIRNMQEPVESVLLDFTKGEEPCFNRAVGISSNEFEHTIPTRFMSHWVEVLHFLTNQNEKKVKQVRFSNPTRNDNNLGAENGRVYSGNRKGKTLIEKFPYSFAAHHSPVRSVERNPSFLKNFITAGDWTVRIWSEDCKESSIVWTFYHPCEVMKACWSPVKQSVFFSARADGVLDVWDFILQQEKPVYSTKLADVPLTALRAHETGRCLAVGDALGRTHVIELSNFFYHADKNDKVLMAALLERESRREKIIEVKVREMKLKAQQRPAAEVEDSEAERQLELENCTKNFFTTVQLIEAGGKHKSAEDDYD